MSTPDPIRPAIARIWRGRTTAANADHYEAYLREVGYPPLVEHALAAQMFREDRADESEFITISFWESITAMSRFAGAAPTQIHHLPRDPELLIELPAAVQILRVAELTWPTGSGAGATD